MRRHIRHAAVGYIAGGGVAAVSGRIWRLTSQITLAPCTQALPVALVTFHTPSIATDPTALIAISTNAILDDVAKMAAGRKRQ